jgi:acyl-[acyl-carrier-protein] desaturase
VSHRNTGQSTGDPVAERLLSRIAMDENLHMIFYRSIVEAALERTPNEMMRAIGEEVMGFRMPGSVIPGFGRKAARMAQAGIYDLRIHYDEIVMPLLRHWGVFDIEGLDSSGEQVREGLVAALAVLDSKATRFVERRAESAARRAVVGEVSR